MVQGKRYKFYKVLTWALLGGILTYIVCAMSLTGDHTVNTPFYNAGDISEISITQFRKDDVQEKGYQEEDGTVVLEQGYYCYSLSLSGYSDDWNYLCVWIDNLKADSLIWEVTYDQVKDDEVTESVTETYTLTEGTNALFLPDQKFNRVILNIYGEDGLSFCVGKIQFQENLPVSMTGTTIALGILTIVCYLVLTGIILLIRRKSKHMGHFPFYGAIEILQEFYLSVAGRLASLQGKFRVNPKRRRIVRTCLFLGMLFYCMTVIFESNYSPQFRYKGLIVILFICAISVFSIEKNPTKKNWNNPLAWGWIVVAVMMCISDFVTQKAANYFPFMGFVLIAFIGFFIFVWNNMENRGEIIEDFIRATHMLLWIVVVFCILFRPYDPAVRYAGVTNNPNGLGVYMAVFWAVVLGSLEHAFRTQGKKRVLLIYIIEACLVFSLAWRTQSATALAAIALVGIIWLVRMMIYTSKNKRKRVLIGTLICTLLLFLPIYAGLSFGLTHVSETLGTAVVYKDEVTIERVEVGTVAYAAESESEGIFESNRLIKKLNSSTITGLLSGRNYIYKEYIRDLNWFGHNTWPDVFGKNNPRNAHNEVLNQAYRYGIFTAIPYIVMLIASLARTWQFGRKKTNYAIVPFFVILVTIVEAMFDVVMNPFNWPTWFGFYLLMGCVFSEECLIEEEDDPCYNKNLDLECEKIEQTEESKSIGEEV